MIRTIYSHIRLGAFALLFSTLFNSAHSALLIHYSFDSEATGNLITGASIENLGTTTNGTAGIPSGSLTIKDDTARPNGALGLLGNYLDIQPAADNNEGTSAAHINSGSSMSSLGIDGNSDYTMMAWVKFDNAINDNMVFGGASGSVLHLGARGNSYWSGHWGDDINSSASPAIDNIDWHHVTWTNTGTTQEIFVDGVSVVQGGAGSAGGFSSNLGQNLLIGTSRNQGSFRGQLDDIGVFTGKLNEFEIAAFHALALDTDYGYNVSQVSQMLDTHNAGSGSSITIDVTTWEYVTANPNDGRFYIELDSGGSGLAGSTGPPIFSFEVDHPISPTGAPITISWNVGTNADSLTIAPDIGDIIPLTTGGIGQITLNPGPSTSTTYTLTATNALGTNTREVIVAVTDQPIIESFTTDQIIVAPGTSVQLDWSVLNVNSLDLNGSNVTGSSSTTVNPTETTTYTLTATNGQGTTSEQVSVTVVIPGEPVINEISTNNETVLLDEDNESTDWIELHNPSGTTAILNDYYLSDDPDQPAKWRLPNMTLAPDEFLIIFASGKDRAIAGSELHTNFSLSSGGEYLALSKIAGGITTFLSEFDSYPNQFEDITWGLFPDGTTLGYFTTPTPGSANGTGLIDYVRDTSFSINRGFYSAPISVAITSNTPDVQIRYTIDGSAPTTTSGTLYTGPIAISSTTILRALAYRSGYLQTNVDTNTYFFLDDIVTQSESAPAGWPAAGTFSGQQYDYGMDSDIVNSSNPAIGGVQQTKDALSAIPSISISLRQSDFSGSGGINSNAGNRGIAWERSASAELIFPNGYIDPDGNSEGFQVDAGLRIRGGFSRSGGNPKHALRLFFRKEYGDSKLRFPIFGEEGTDRFDNLDLRTAQNYSWAFQNDSGRNTFLREVFSRDTQRDMGHPYTRSRYYHVYINGVYWGLYMTQERAEASYAESYFGGEKENFDTVKSAGSSGGYTVEATDGNLDAWRDIHTMGRNLLNPTFPDKRAEYYKIQGLDSNGVRDPNLPVLINMENFIDYMLLTFWVGNFDAPLSNFLGNDRPNNYFSIYDRTNPEMGFTFFAHDGEHSLFNGWDRTGPFNSANRSDFRYANPQFLHEDLLQNLDAFTREEYQYAWADRAQKLMFNDGVLTQTKALERINTRATIVDQVIIAESARWGDSKGADPPHDRNDWTGAKDNLLNIASGRNAVLLGQLQGDNLYPTTDAPVFSQHGGNISSSTELSISNNGGIIYYTTDGSDPRLLGGGISPTASIYTGTTTTTTLVASGSEWKYLDDGSNQGTAWVAPAFNDSSWQSGDAELGYGDGGEATEVGFGPDPNNTYVTTYFRKTFTATNVSSLTSAVLELQRDDGAIVYLNGNEIVRSNMPGGVVTSATFAAGTVSGTAEATFLNFAISPSALVEGSNTLAVEIHQAAPDSTDLSFDLRLRATESTTANPLFLTETGPVLTRALEGGIWSAATEADFIVDAVSASSSNLVITELHYRPASPTPSEEDAGYLERSEFEYVELMNIGTADIDLTNVRFTNGITFDFDDSSLGIILSPGQRILLVNHLAAFQLRYPSIPSSQIAGEFSGSLSNGGELITLLATDNQPIRSFTYDDSAPWPESSDGDGFSLTLIYPSENPDHADPFSWRPSVGIGGSPGATDATDFTGDPEADDDFDSVPALIEYLLGTSDSISSSDALPTAQTQALNIGGIIRDYLTLEFTIDLSADDAGYEVQISNDLELWSSGPGEVEFVSRINNGDGTATLIYRSAAPVSDHERHFIRLNASLRTP